MSSAFKNTVDASILGYLVAIGHRKKMKNFEAQCDN
jgi:hypothetical protein